jgi:RNA polymerase sigma-70 factor (ECF subfamily)
VALDHAQFHELFLAQRDRLFRFLFRLCGSAADADDLLQEAFLATWRKRTSFDGRGSAEGWIRRTAFRLWLDARRRRVRRDGLAPSAPAPAAGASDPSGPERRDAVAFLVARVEDAVAALPDGPREAFVMFRFEGMPCAEIADLIGVPVKTVETRVRRATQLLAEALRPHRQHLPTA